VKVKSIGKRGPHQKVDCSIVGVRPKAGRRRTVILVRGPELACLWNSQIKCLLCKSTPAPQKFSAHLTW
jgi:hypothetical protein